MTVSFVGFAAGTNATEGASVTIPATALAGDLLVAVLETNSVSGYSHPAPIGWASYGTVVGGNSGNPGGSQTATVFTKTADGTDPGAVIMFPVSPTGSTDIVSVAAYRGSLSAPVVTDYGALPVATAVATISTPVVAVDTMPTTLVLAAVRKGGTVAHTPTVPSGATLRGTGNHVGGSTISASIADIPAGGVGPTAVGEWTYAPAGQAGCGFILAIREGVLPTPIAPVPRKWTATGWYPPRS